MKRKIQNMYERNRRMFKKLLCGLLVSAMVCGQTVPAWATSKAEKENRKRKKSWKRQIKKPRMQKAKRALHRIRCQS